MAIGNYKRRKAFEPRTPSAIVADNSIKVFKLFSDESRPHSLIALSDSIPLSTSGLRQSLLSAIRHRLKGAI
jgi:hypothetical protein